jgi:hypothetical protein
LINLARDVAWLLNGQVDSDYESLQPSYTNLLISRNLASRGGLLKRLELAQALNSYYSPDLLELLQCKIGEHIERSWSSRVVFNVYTNHPLRHLLLIQFLGHTAESFFELRKRVNSIDSERPRPFGSGPWPCLNPVCANYRQQGIHECEITRHRSTKSNIIVGSFGCVCGFTYIRNGPDQFPEDHFRYSRIKCFGAVWEAELARLWQDYSISLCKISRHLGVSNDSTKTQALRLKLNFPRPGLRKKPTQISKQRREVLKRKRYKQSQLIQKRAKFRKDFTTILKQNPSASRTELREFPPRRVYTWLYRYDKEWLETHLPPPLPGGGAGGRNIDWATRDVRLAEKVLWANSNIRQLEGPPIRVSVSAICRYIENTESSNNDDVSLTNNRKYLDRLPLTSQALNEAIESTIEFWLRKLQWAIEYFRKEGDTPSCWQFMARAGVDRRNLTNPEVKASVEEALSSLQQGDTSIIYDAA